IAPAIYILIRGIMLKFITHKATANSSTFLKLQTQTISSNKVLHVQMHTVTLECNGIFLVYISTLACDIYSIYQIAFIGYSVVLMILMSSPFLRGIGVIEIALTYTLTLFGIPTTEALSIAFLFRFFEFWSFTILGVFAMVLQRDNVL